MRRSRIVAGILITLSLGGYTLVGAQAPSDLSGTQPSVELPADLDRVLRDYERHWSSGEAEALAALFVEEGLIVHRGSWIRGRVAIREAYRSASGPLRLRAIEYAASDSMGYIVGAYGYGEDLPVEETGMFVLTLRRVGGGRWLIVSDLDRRP
jgi:hypothetical protein